MNRETSDNFVEAIAIIGMVGRFAKASNLEEFWQNLCNGVESITFYSTEELLALGVRPEKLSSNWVKASANIDGIDMLDATFFGFHPVEAEATDPQHRIFLECAWEALETAAYNSDTFKGRVGVYAGTGLNWYKNQLLTQVDDFTIAIGNMPDYLATRVAYKLNLKGPSLTVQTACSTSLVATSLACQGLLNYQTDMALAGGVSLSISRGYPYHEGSIHSPDGRCRTFDAKAKGTFFGSGVGVVVLKRLSDAIADGDQIHAVIKGFAVNNDGISKIGYTAPGVDGQAQAVAEAIAMADVDPETITYVESHGTATSLGDPIEIAALTKAYRASTQKKGFCAVGSVKTNIGHTDAAAGVAGLMKTALCLKHKKLPASLNFEEPNPRIDFANSPFYVNTRLAEWKSGETPRRAGVSSFGIGGTNAHVILEEAPPLADSGPSRPGQLFLLSAKTSTALDTMTANLTEYLKKNPDINPADVAYTLQVGRKVFDHRRMLVAGGVEDAVKALEQPDARVISAIHDSVYRPVVFMFPGQGSQHVQMALDLYRLERTFSEQVDRCCELIKPYLGLDLRDVLYAESDKAEEATGLLNQTYITQPALFVIEYALAKLWMEWGIQPEAMVGHSIGEYVAACLSGVISLEDALKLVVQRGRVMQEMPPGAMLSVSVSETQARSFLGEGLSLAAVNAPSLCVVSGETEAIEALEHRLAREGVFYRRLHTSHAFHSEMMEPALAPFIKEVEKVKLSPPQIPYLSNVTGTWITDAEATDPGYWAKHLRQAVRFSDNIVELLKDETRVFLEVGPGQTSQMLVKQHLDGASEREVTASLRRPQEQCSDMEFILGSLGRLWLAGVTVDWQKFYARERRHRLALPTYPFERQRFWIARGKNNEVKEPAAYTGKKPDIADWFYLPRWKQSVPAAFLERDAAPVQPSCWLVFIDESGLGAQMVERLKQNGHKVIGVRIGEEFSRVDDDTFVANPAKPDDYLSLIQQLDESAAPPSRIAHFWSVTPDSGEPSRLESFESLQDVGFYSLVFLAQALGARSSKDPIQIAVVSNRMQDVTGDEERFLEKATLIGPCRVIPQEYPHIGCRSVDIDLPSSAKDREQLTEDLIAELNALSPDAVVAYRKNQRWVQTFEPLRMTDEPRGEIAIRQGGVYLITGGMGGIGLALSEHLARTGKAKLALITRSAFPAREDWQSYLEEHDREDEVSRRINQVKALEEMGAEVVVFVADVADLPRMQEVINRTRERFGPINGVIHSAGVPAGGMIQLKNREMADSILSPKVRGAFILDSLLKGEKLDFFILFSSIASIIGGVGQVDYCAANAFLDAFAQSRSRRDDALTLSVGWGAWAEVGMAVKARKIWSKAPLKAAQVNQETPSNGASNGNGSAHLHPLLDECVYDGDQQTFVTHFSPSRQWVLGQHKVQGYPTLVGTSYLEMARAALATETNGSPVEIRDVIFMGPMVVDEGDTREFHLVVKNARNGKEFIAKSKSGAAGNGGSEWQEHVRGRIASVSEEAPKIHSLDGWGVASSTDNSPRNEILASPLADALAPNGGSAKTEGRGRGRGPVTLGPRWRGLVDCSIGTDRAWACFELPEEFSTDLEGFKLHPAMMDAATSFALSLVEKGNTFYLPFSYGRVRIAGALTRKIYSYARLREESAPEKGIVSFDIVITNDKGLELVAVEAFTMKKVGGIDIRGRSREEGNGSAPGAPSDARKATVETELILPAEGVEVFRRLLSKHLPPEVIISPSHLQARLERARTSTSSAAVERLEKKVKAAHPRPNLKTPYVAPESDLEKDIAAVWRAVLGIAEIGVNDNFLELGGHSLIAIQIVHRLRDAYEINLPMDAVFKSLTVAELAPVILNALTEQADEETLAKLLDDIEQLPE